MALNPSAANDLKLGKNLAAPKKTAQFQLVGEPSLTQTPQNRPLAVPTTALQATAPVEAKNQDLNQPIRTKVSHPSKLLNKINITTQNSQIHGRKVDSPKIYVKEDLNESRPKTSAQTNRKNAAAQPNQSLLLGHKIRNIKQTKNSFKATGVSPGAFFFSTSGSGVTSAKDNEQRRFDFTFQTSNSITQRGLTDDQLKQEVKLQNSQTQSAEIQTKKSGTKALLNGALSKYQQSRQIAQSNANISAQDLAKVKETKLGSTKHQRKRNQSQSNSQQQPNQPKPAKLQFYKHLSDSAQNSTSLCAQQPMVNIQLQVNSPQTVSKTPKIQARLPPKQPKTARADQKPLKSKRNRSTDANSKPSLAAAQKLKGKKPRLNQTLTQGLQGLAGVNQTTNAAQGFKTQKSGNTSNLKQKLGGKHSNHFSFELDNKENLVSNNSKNKLGGPLSDPGKSASGSRSRRGRSIPAGRGRESLHNDVSISSLSHSSQPLRGEVQGNLSKMFNKNYFLDGEQLLRQLSPGTPNRSDDHVKSLISSQVNNSAGINRKEGAIKSTKSKFQNFKQTQKLSSDKFQGLENRSGKFTNLEKKQAQDLLKKFFAEEQKKTAEREKQTKNWDDQRKVQDVFKQKYKKKRSKSCISKVDVNNTVFSGRIEKQRDKSNEIQNQTCLLSDAFNGSRRGGAGRERNCVLELTQLKKEICEEIRRDIKDGLISPDVMSGGNMSVKNQKPRPISTKAKHAESNLSKNQAATSSTPNYTSLRQGEAALFLENEKSNRRKEAGKKSCPEMNNTKIRKFIERQKKKQQAKKCLEETIVHEKSMRIKQTLIDLQNFSRTGERPQRQLNVRSSYQISLKKSDAKNSTQQIGLLDHIRHHLPLKNLRAQHPRPQHAKNSVHTDRLHESSQFDSENGLEAKRESIKPSEFERTFQHEGVPILNEDSQIINIFKKELSSSNSASRKQSSKRKQRRAVDEEQFFPIPLKELKPKLQKPQELAKQPVLPGHSIGNKKQLNTLKPIQQNLDSEDSQEKLPRKPSGKRKIENAFGSLDSKKNKQLTGGITGSDFESLEPSRGADDRRKNQETPKNFNERSNTTDKYEQSEFIPDRRKKEQNRDTLKAVVVIQQWFRQVRQRRMKEDSSDSILHSGRSPSKEQNTAQSIRKNTAVPSLNLEKINSAEQSNNPYKTVGNTKNQLKQEPGSARSTSIFDRDTFQEQFKVSNLKPKDDVDLPELQKLRVEAIENEKKTRQQQLQIEFEQNKFSPRTFEQKKQMLEKWVTKKKEEVKTNAKKAEELEWENTQKVMDSTNKDYLQVKLIILGSGRSSSKNNNAASGRDTDHLNPPISSVRTDQLNSYRIDSKRNSQRAQPSLIDLINNTKNNAAGINNDSSSQSRQGRNKNGLNSEHSQSNSQSQISQSLIEDEENGDDTDQFQQVYIRNNGVGWEKAVKHNTKTEEDENKFIGSFNQKHKTKESEAAENTLKRVDSFTNLVDSKPLNKNVARVNLKVTNDADSESDIARQIREVSPKGSSSSGSSPVKDEQLAGLRSDTFFMNKMESHTHSPKGLHDSQVTRADSNIRIEIGGETQHQKKAGESNLIGAVSPLSGASSDFGIQRGSMSLESSASGETQNALQQAIREVGREQDLPIHLSKDMTAKVEYLTDELLKALIQELSQDFPQLVSRSELLQMNEMQEAAQAVQGIKTDLFAIEKYVDEVVEEIKLNSVEFMRILNIPLAKDQIQILYQLQNSDIGSCEHFDETFPQVLPLDLYLTLEKRRKENREKNIQEQKEQAAKVNSQTDMLKILLAECEHIHNKVLFDCINDSLLQFKPYGKEGAPLSWSRKNRRLKPTDDFTINEIFEIVKHDVSLLPLTVQLFRWAITNAGTLPRREFVYRGVFDEELFTEIREKKLVSLLAREMIESEPKWLNYEFEHAQVKIDVGDMILEQLVTECIAILSAQRDLTDEDEDSLKNRILDDLHGRSESQDSRTVPADKSKYSDFSNNNEEDDWNL